MDRLEDHGGWPAILGTLTRGDDMSAAAASAALTAILSGAASDAQISGFTVALLSKTESISELTGLVAAMRDAATRIDLPRGAIDIVGTGGSPSRRSHALNVSTMACFVAAAAGAVVCKHGNRKASSTSGSFDFLEALGVRITVTAGELADQVRRIELGFAFARSFHPAMRHVAGVRAELGIPTVFNILGPLSHPGRVTRQVVGVADAALAPKLAAVLEATGSQRALVVHGSGRLDELTTTGPSQVLELRDGRTRGYEIDAVDFGLARARPADLHGGDPATNVACFEAILAGEPGPRRDIVALNAAAGLLVAGVVDDLAAGVEAACAAIDDGRTARKVQDLIRFSGSRDTGS